MKPVDCGKLYEDACLYDEQHRDYVEDIPFYEKILGDSADPVLELMCGTGRITIPLAQKGIPMTGIDVSSHMLTLAKKKATNLRLPIQWINCDVRTFRLPEFFSMIFIPFNSITHLHDRNSIDTCFDSIRQHLEDKGLFIIDVFVPELRYLLRDPNIRYPVADLENPNGSGRVLITESNVYNKATQINHIKWFYNYECSGQEIVVENNMRMFFPQELDNLLFYNGFKIIGKFGNYDFDRFSSSSQKQLMVMQKR